MDHDNTHLHPGPQRQTSTLSRKKKPVGYCTYQINRALTCGYAVYLVVIGIILISLGLWTVTLKDYVNGVFSMAAPTFLLIILGVLLIIFGLIGIYGAIAEAIKVLKTFLIFIILLLIIQVIVTIIVFIYREKAANAASSSLQFVVTSYGGTSDRNKSLTERMDHIQKKFQCCGWRDFTDYNHRYTCNNGEPNECKVPWSCCHQDAIEEYGKENCGDNVLQQDRNEARARVNVDGCITSLQLWISEHLQIVGAIALALAVPQILGILVTYWMLIRLGERRVMYNYHAQIEYHD